MTSSTPLISVVVPFWNATAFLEEAIKSVVAQTFEDWELILVDDGSRDGGTEVAKQYVERFPGRMRHVEHEGHQNRGVAASRNLGVRHANGQYIAFLDADDVWLPHKLARQIAILEAEPEAAMVCGPSQFWFSWTGRPEDSARDYVKDLRIAPAGLVRAPTLLISSLTRGTFVANPSTIVIRRGALDRVGGFEESFVGAVQTFEDDAFLAKVQLSESVYVDTECLSRYRRHENSLLSIMTNTGQARATQLFYLNWLEKYLAQQRVESDEIQEALRRALWPYRHPILDSIRNPKRRLSIPNLKGFLVRVARQTLLRKPRTTGEPHREQRPGTRE